MTRRSLRTVLQAAGALLLLAGVLGAAAPGSGRQVNPPVAHLSWRAPYGMPGATPAIDATCADSTHRDTLYVSFEPAQDESSFVGVGGDLYIYAQPGDTLGSFWDMGRGGRNHGGLLATFRPDESIPGPSPWNGQGTGSVSYERAASSALYRFGAVIGIYSGMPLRKGTAYTAGRIVFFSKGRNLTGCDQPVCIEWRSADFVFGPHREVFPTYAGSAVVTRGPAAAACRNRIPAWRPPGAAAAPEVSVPDSSR